jgi:hypothetical protein
MCGLQYKAYIGTQVTLQIFLLLCNCCHITHNRNSHMHLQARNAIITFSVLQISLTWIITFDSLYPGDSLVSSYALTELLLCLLYYESSSCFASVPIMSRLARSTATLKLTQTHAQTYLCRRSSCAPIGSIQ